MPIEVGFSGLIKYIIKRLIYRYKLCLPVSDYKYIYALILGNDISKFRPIQSGYSSHFGFNYKNVENLALSFFPSADIQAKTIFTTRILTIT